jgi:hypothetical protein
MHHPMRSSASNFNNAYALQRGGDLHQPGNSHPPSALNAIAKNKLDPQNIHPSPSLGRERRQYYSGAVEPRE